jgi:hypothetical protein
MISTNAEIEVRKYTGKVNVKSNASDEPLSENFIFWVILYIEKSTPKEKIELTILSEDIPKNRICKNKELINT